MKKHNKMMRMLIALFIGAIAGFAIGFGIPFFNDMTNYLNNTLNIHIMPYIIALLFFIAFYLYYLSTKQYNAMKNRTYSSEDAQYIHQLKSYNKASMNIVNATNIAVLAFALTIANFLFLPTMHNIIICAVFAVVFLVFITISRMHNIKILSHYPKITNSDFEIDYQDRNILNTIIDHIDEGERLVMLHALSKTYTIMIYMLSCLLILLAIYQAGTGENQVFAMVGVTAVLVYSTIAYYKKSEEFNR
ncbi:DUF3169 family protein [Macrococcus capreoli]|uniref:DUF3169 family protein n=1 Tax=Macrococcus capreoli TaxID=2982690 RepID=UPI003F4388B7